MNLGTALVEPPIDEIERSDAWALVRTDSLRWLATRDPDSVDGFVMDPPYSSGGQFRGDRTASVVDKYQQSGHAQGDYPEFYGDTRDGRGMLAWLSLVFADAWRVTKPSGVIVTFSDWRMLPTMTDAVQAGGWVWRGIVPWYKPNARRQLGRFTGACEFAIWGSKGPMPVERDVGALPGFFRDANVSPELREPPAYIQSNSVPGDDRQHVTEKPESVMRELVKLVTPGGLVCDPFTGSGTTGVAALLEGRRFVGCELSPEYFRVACDRFRALANLEHRKDAARGQVGLFAQKQEQDT
ncbi:MAG TPA: site-specific DNA-methyltransferase [Kofleriaceae bacterium]|nr:site-specific DNA-methyltransferase [Kofleriaceae bacterium]